MDTPLPARRPARADKAAAPAKPARRARSTSTSPTSSTPGTPDARDAPDPPILPTAPNKPNALPTGEQLVRALTYRLHLLQKLTDQDSQQAYLTRLGLSLSDGRCLATIGSFEPLSVKDLALRGNLDKGQASRAAQTLVDRGLVAKQDDRSDGRGVVLTLTVPGRALWRRTMALVRERNTQIFECLDAEEQARLSKLLDRVIAHVRRD